MLDNPPTSCSVEETRDCGNGQCICMFRCFQLNSAITNIYILVTAIANYTIRVAETSLSSTQRQEALKFLGMSYTIRL